MSDWRPMDTAPRDGTRILAAWDDCRPVEIVHWQDGTQRWSADDAWEWEPPPTRWMPLPET